MAVLACNRGGGKVTPEAAAPTPEAAAPMLAPASAVSLAVSTPCEDSIPPKLAERFESGLVSGRALDNRLLHDCQRLLVNRDQYGPLVSILAAKDIDIRIRDHAREGVVIADIINYGGEAYAPLDIQPNNWHDHFDVNCLWVQGDPTGNPKDWVAEIRHGPNCTDVSRLAPARQRLQVHAIRYATNEEHPGTARWGWSNPESVQFIGIHCGNYWCEIGTPGFTGSVGRTGEDFSHGDEQYLAAVDPATGGLVPSHVWGRIEALKGLATANEDSLRHPKRVARITLRADPPDPEHGPKNADVQAYYVNRYKLNAATTDIWMRYNGVTQKYELATTSNESDQNWTAMNRCPWRHAAVGAVRWRWSETDETAWFACSDGCCSAARIGPALTVP